MSDPADASEHEMANDTCRSIGEGAQLVRYVDHVGL